MNRHAFMMDLLAPNITAAEIAANLKSKQELTPEDLQQIIDVAVKIVFAANEVLAPE